MKALLVQSVVIVLSVLLSLTTSKEIRKLRAYFNQILIIGKPL